VGAGTVYKTENGGRVEVEVEVARRKVAMGRRSRPPLAMLLALSWVARSRWAFPHRDEGNPRLDRCARWARRSALLVWTWGSRAGEGAGVRLWLLWGPVVAWSALKAR
jgi:hypothetical protein